MHANEWICPCPECNGLGPRQFDQFEDDDAMVEPEHPENECPKPVGFWFYADTLR